MGLWGDHCGPLVCPYAACEAYCRLLGCKVSLFFSQNCLSLPISGGDRWSFPWLRPEYVAVILAASASHASHLQDTISLDLCRGLLRLPSAPPGLLASCLHITVHSPWLQTLHSTRGLMAFFYHPAPLILSVPWHLSCLLAHSTHSVWVCGLITFFTAFSALYSPWQHSAMVCSPSLTFRVAFTHWTDTALMEMQGLLRQVHLRSYTSKHKGSCWKLSLEMDLGSASTFRKYVSQLSTVS